MKYRNLGKSDLKVSLVAFGGWSIGGGEMWGETSEEESIRTIHAAFDSGITFFDTAPPYGDGKSEKLLGKALSGRRSDALIATKLSPPYKDRDHTRRMFEKSLKNLQTDYVDLLQLHWPSTEHIGNSEIIDLMLQLKTEGKVREIGISNFGPYELEHTDGIEHCISNQLPYNLLFRAIEYEILPAVKKRNMGLLAYSTLMHGLLAGKFNTPEEVPEGRARTRHFSSDRPLARHGEPGHEVETFSALLKIRNLAEESGLSMWELSSAWILQRDGVSCALIGARNPLQAVAHARVADIVLGEDMILSLNEATSDLKNAMGPNPDMWQADSRVHYSE